MKLVSLTMTNFMPYRGEQKILFPENQSQNVLVIVGDNMKGKTSLLNALRWGFYGVAMGRHMHEHPLHLLHNSEACQVGHWMMEVAIDFEVDGHKYELRRRSTKKRHVAEPNKPEDFDVQTLLRRDGIPINGFEIQAEINRFAPEQVSRFFLFDGELLQEYETLLIEGSEQGKNIKEAIEQVLGVPALTNGRDEAGTLLRAAQRQQNIDLAQIKGAESHRERQSRFQSQSENLEEEIKKLRSLHKVNKDELSALEDAIEKHLAQYNAKVLLTERERQHEEVEREIDALNAEKLSLVANAWRDLLIPKARAKLDGLLSRQAQALDSLSKKNAYESELQRTLKLIQDSICPTCSQPIKSEHIADASRRVAELESHLRNEFPSAESLKELTLEIDSLNRLTSQAVGAQIQDKERQINRLSVSATKLLNEIEDLKKVLEGHDTAEIMRKRALRDALVKEEKRIELAIAESTKSLDKAKQELAVIEIQLNKIPEARAKRSSALVEVYSALEKTFSASVEQLRNNLRRHVEAKANEAFRAMTTQGAYKGLRINENYGLSILDDKGKVVPIRSAGAEQIVALSLIDGLSHTGRAAGPIVMDTPFGRLDLKHRNNILRYLPTAASQLVLLVHDGEVRIETDLLPIADRIGGTYHIREKTLHHSVIERG